MLEIGSLVDSKYKILAEVGRGGMSVVYLALNEKANKQWAIKVIRKDGIKDLEVVKTSLLVETELLKKLSHPNLPSIIDVIDTDDTFIIVMDYIEGNPLSRALEEFGAQPQEMVVEWAKQLCDVLGYLHTRNPAIIYRDLKPANIMLKPDGNVMLIDFGTAREFKEKNLADTTCLGTQGYAAPEQFGGMGQTDGRTDIYCLGATLYHLVTGWNPCMPPYEILPIREINPQLSSGLESIILKSTQRNPEDRYQSAAELMYELDNYEKIDHLYRRKQVGKLTRFIVVAGLAVIFTVAGFICRAQGLKTLDADYVTAVGLAVAADPEEKLERFEEAIKLKPADLEAYRALAAAVKSPGSERGVSFTVNEANHLTRLIIANETALSVDKEAFAELLHEVGVLYWYYYDNGTANVVRMTTAAPWFDKAIHYGGENFAHKRMAQVYREIGDFYQRIDTAVIEGRDKNLYKPFWEVLTELLVEIEETDEEIVRLELYELARNSIQKYASKLKSDGISKEEVMAVFGLVFPAVEAIQATTDTTAEKQNNTVAKKDATLKAIEIAYGVHSEGEEP